MTIANSSMNKQRGFTLIEALVAFLILSVGMLGIASLQAISLRAGYTATLRTVAVIKSEEVLERMRANQTALDDYTSTATAGLVAPAKECTYQGTAIVSCTPAEMAPYDVYKWKQDLLSMFPANTTATIVVTAPVDPTVTPLSVVTVAINWKERDPSASGVLDMNYTTTQDVCGAASC